MFKHITPQMLYIFFKYLSIKNKSIAFSYKELIDFYGNANNDFIKIFKNLKNYITKKKLRGKLRMLKDLNIFINDLEAEYSFNDVLYIEFYSIPNGTENLYLTSSLYDNTELIDLNKFLTLLIESNQFETLKYII